MISSTVEDVGRKEDVGYDAVEGAIERCIHATVNWDEFDELNVIGIDEIALTKGRKNFIAIVTTQQADGHVAVLAVLPDRKKKTVVVLPHLCGAGGSTGRVAAHAAQEAAGGTGTVRAYGGKVL